MPRRSSSSDVDKLTGAIQSLEETLKTHSTSFASGSRRLGFSLQDKYLSLLTDFTEPAEELGRLSESPTRSTKPQVGGR